ncbi:DUF6318 family protein [Nocardioides sp. W7]|uniref:DUF6318 family protein n=1 Tax=Nocardioides sp. W7 TaxID=2931390 RepID=UPI001FD18231|nr:DUF6318 family protein [Nocardioides sp. W7]
MRRLSTVTLAMGLVLLAGCTDGDDPEPKVPPTNSSSAVSTPTPTPTGPVEPTLPPEAEGDDAAAAEAFVRFYWETAHYAQASGDVEGLEALASTSCRNCRSGTDYLRDAFAQGASFKGGETTVTSTVSTEYEAGPVEGFEVRARVRNEKQIVDWPEPKDDEVFPAAVISTRFLVERQESGFAIGFWETLS